MLLTSFAFVNAQTSKFTEVSDGLIKYESFDKNSALIEEGYYQDKKLHGTWTSYKENGQISTIGEYDNGQKVNKWVFYLNDRVIHVKYSQSKIKWYKTEYENKVAYK